ncbi:hypothetical protein CKY04_22910 [Photorhabdus sp. S8-52]|nr:hypothetical protein CKY05_22885 [Photorhabdus sp. S10-54]RAW92805.1 hypothetical protein CKY03_22780 [Photorhabdus sp. S9-53]RAW96318.1 hypothetical protein CKY04_22910 [Photorhabdus sp. S8-52]
MIVQTITELNNKTVHGLSSVVDWSVPFFRGLPIPVIFQVASLLAVLVHPSHIVSYAPGDSLPCRRDAS